jgi:hypothetical protein
MTPLPSTSPWRLGSAPILAAAASSEASPARKSLRATADHGRKMRPQQLPHDSPPLQLGSHGTDGSPHSADAIAATLPLREGAPPYVIELLSRPAHARASRGDRRAQRGARNEASGATTSAPAPRPKKHAGMQRVSPERTRNVSDTQSGRTTFAHCFERSCCVEHVWGRRPHLP